MAGSVVGYASAAGQTNTLTVTKAAVESSLGGTVTNGDVIVAIMVADWGVLPATPGGWTELLVRNDGDNSAYHARVQARVAASEGTDWTFSTTTGDTPDATLQIIVLRDVTITGAVGSMAAGLPAGATVAAPSVDHAGIAGSVLLCGVAAEEDGAGSWSYTPPAGMTEWSDIQSGFWVASTSAYLLDPTDPTGAKTFTLGITDTGTAPVAWSLVLAPSVATTAPSLVSDRGSTANATAATTSSVTLTSPTAIAVGNYLIARVAVDNSGGSGAAPGCTVTDPRSNSWTVLGPALADPGAASAGATAYLCYTRVVTAYQAADALTFNWGGISTTAKAIVVEEWTNIHSTSPVAASAVTNNSVTAGSTTAVTTGAITPTAPNQLVYTCLATEGIAGDTVGADGDTTNGSWVTLTTTASANATATNNQRVSGQYKIVTTAGSQTWDSTITSRDWGAIAVVFAPPAFPPPIHRVVRQAIHRSHYW